MPKQTYYRKDPYDNRRRDFDYLSQWNGSYTDRVRVVSFAFGCALRKASPNTKPTNPVKQYSNEYEQNCSEEDCYLLFDDVEESRYLRIRMGGHNHTTAQNIVIALDNLEEIVDIKGERWTMFTLRHSPSFDTEPNHPPLRPDETIDKYRYRTRYPSLNRSPDFIDRVESHYRVAPYASRVLFVQFHHETDIETFKRQAGHFALPTISTQEIDVDTHLLYSDKRLRAVRKMVQSLPFAVAYQCDALLFSGLVNPVEICSMETRIKYMLSEGEQHTVDVLRRWIVILKQYASDWTIPTGTLFDFAVHDSKNATLPPTRRAMTTNDHLVAQITCTPSTMILTGPEPDVSNRVLRWYSSYQDHFVRVTLADEDKMSYRFAYEIDNSQEIYQKVIMGLLLNGVYIGGRHFHYLGYSMSALRTHAFWFINPFTDINGNIIDADAVMERIGNFSASLRGKTPIDHYPALFPARAAQAFSATEVSVLVRRSEIQEEQDDVTRNGYTFTDGVGRISPELAEHVWATLLQARRFKTQTMLPSAFQIRLCGFKGVLVVDHRLKGRTIHFRKSMKKFDVHGWSDLDRMWPLEIAKAVDRPMLMHLNRPMIMLLENNGVKSKVFLEYQRRAVREARKCLTSADDLAITMDFYGLGISFATPSLIRALSIYKILSFDNLTLQNHSIPGFINRLAQLTNVHVLRELKHHARIPVPKAWTLVGVADEWGMLGENEVYACILDPKTMEEPLWLEGKVLISRSPTIHPGDAQFATAIGKPPVGSIFERQALPNVLIFSTRGERDLPSQLGGGDLDGDIFNIITSANESLFMVDGSTPGEYEAIKRKELDRPATKDDIAENLVEYIDNDVVGLVATNHLLIADRSDFGLNDPKCLTLSELHSQAVDYPKTGVPVQTSKIPRPDSSQKPDWNAGEWRDPNSSLFYTSEKAVGKLFRDIKSPDLPEIPSGLLMPAFRRVIDAAEEERVPSPPPQWPARATAEQRLDPSNYPRLPDPSPTPQPAYAKNGQKYQASKPAATTLKIVRNGVSASNNGKGDLSVRSRGAATPSPSIPHRPASHSGPLSPPPGLGISPGLGPPPGLGLPPGLSISASVASSANGRSTPSVATSIGQPASPAFSSRAGRGRASPPTDNVNSTRGNSFFDDVEPNSVLGVTERLCQLARPYVDLHSASKELKKALQLVYGRFVIELQHISVALALDQNLTEEELVVGTITAKSQQPRRRRQLMERMRTNVSTIVLDLRRAIRGEYEDNDNNQANIPPSLSDILLRAYVAYYVAALDADECVWGAASMCMISLGVFCDTIQSLRENDQGVASRMGDEVEASRVELLMQIQDDNE